MYVVINVSFLNDTPFNSMKMMKKAYSSRD